MPKAIGHKSREVGTHPCGCSLIITSFVQLPSEGRARSCRLRGECWGSQSPGSFPWLIMSRRCPRRLRRAGALGGLSGGRGGRNADGKAERGRRALMWRWKVGLWRPCPVMELLDCEHCPTLLSNFSIKHQICWFVCLFYYWFQCCSRNPQSTSNSALS